MNRRKFVRSSLITGGLLSSGLPQSASAAFENAASEKRLWYELRTYLFKDTAQQGLTGAYLEQAAIPAFHRAGLKDIGVFSELKPAEGPGKMFVLIPFPSIQAFAGLEDKLSKDPVYLKAGEEYLSTAATSPAYLRIESSLLRAFTHMPGVEAPEKKERIFELRCYESPTESAGQKKIDMFNDLGEIDIFKKVGARPVFFGETIIGDRRPNLTYMLCFDNMEAHDSHWKTFGSDPEWKKISAVPEYSDARLISKITRVFLAPATYSQI